MDDCRSCIVWSSASLTDGYRDIERRFSPIFNAFVITLFVSPSAWTVRRQQSTLEFTPPSGRSLGPMRTCITHLAVLICNSYRPRSENCPLRICLKVIWTRASSDEVRVQIFSCLVYAFTAYLCHIDIVLSVFVYCSIIMAIIVFFLSLLYGE